jgi:hypothetical protein
MRYWVLPGSTVSRRLSGVVVRVAAAHGENVGVLARRERHRDLVVRTGQGVGVAGVDEGVDQVGAGFAVGLDSVCREA